MNIGAEIEQNFAGTNLNDLRHRQFVWACLSAQTPRVGICQWVPILRSCCHIQVIVYMLLDVLSSVILLHMDRLLLRPTEAADLIGVGRSKVYELIAKGDIPSLRIGSSVRVPVD